MEAWLIFASCMAIFLAAVYSVTAGKATGLTIEVALASTLIVSLVFSAAYLIIHYRKEMRAIARAKIARVTEVGEAVPSTSSAS